MQSDIASRANGRWFDILSALGVGSNYLRSKHGPCQVCGGKDRFRWDNKNGTGTFYCGNCGAGNGFKLLMLANGWDFKETAQKIETVIGVSRKMSSRRELTSEEARAAMRERWASCIAIEPGDPVSKYLAARLGVVPMSKVLRFDPQRRAMVALMQ